LDGDARQVFLHQLLQKDGFDAILSCDEAALSGADCILLPILTPGNAPHFAELLKILRPNQLVFGGNIGPELLAQATRQGFVLRDYLLRAELAVANAVPTAEGALQLAMEHLPITIHGCRVLVAGFGRVGQCTAQRFQALGAKVTVCARSPAQLALAESMGYTALSLNELSARSRVFDLVINTIPAPIFDRAGLEQLGSPLLMELASSPGGFDLEAVQTLNLHLLPAPGLPGKVAPLTAAQNLQKTIYRMLEELNFGKERSF